MTTALAAIALIVLAGVATLAFAMGRERGRDDMRQQIEEDTRQAEKDREQVDKDVANRPDDQVDKDIEKWYRD